LPISAEGTGLLTIANGYFAGFKDVFVLKNQQNADGVSVFFRFLLTSGFI